MNFNWIRLTECFFYSGLAGLGFGILFNIPRRVAITVFGVAATAGLIKFGAMAFGVHIILASFYGALLAGVLAIPLSGSQHTSPYIVSIPSVIPMIPGYFGYKTLLGVMAMAMNPQTEPQMEILPKLINSGLNMLFILASLTAGVSLPWLILRHRVRFLRGEKSTELV